MSEEREKALVAELAERLYEHRELVIPLLVYWFGVNATSLVEGYRG